MLSCGTSNFDRSFCVGSPARLLEKTLQMLCAGRSSGKDEDVVAPPFVHREPFLDLPVRSSSRLHQSSRGSSCTQLTNRKPVAIWPSSLIETVPICQLPFFTLQSMGYWIPIKGSYTSWASRALVGSMMLHWWFPAKPDLSSAVLAW